MTNILQFLADHVSGVAVILMILFAIIGIIQYVCWIFRWGRFKVDALLSDSVDRRTESTVRHMVVKFFVEIINDFRHLLALVIVIIFAVTLLAVCQAGFKLDNFDGVKEGIQVVTSSLGGLVGSIIGYYFGESAAKKESSSPLNQGPPIIKQSLPDSEATGPAATPESSDIQSAPLPPGVRGSDPNAAN